MAVCHKGLEMKSLHQCESVIAKGNKAFFAVSEAFLTIKREKLWEGHGKSFSDYCLQRWGLSQSEVSRYVRAAEVLENLKDFGTQPENEGQARVLGRLAPDRQREVWKEVVDKGERISAKLIEQVAGLHHGTVTAEEQEDAPPKEATTLRLFAQAVEALKRVAVGGFAAEEADNVRELLVEARQYVTDIESKLSLRIVAV
jgi:hypothetical protein